MMNAKTLARTPAASAVAAQISLAQKPQLKLLLMPACIDGDHANCAQKYKTIDGSIFYDCSCECHSSQPLKRG